MLAIWSYLCWKRPDDRIFLAVFLVLFASSKYFRIHFAEHRFYFGMLCSTAAAALTLRCYLRDINCRRLDQRIVFWAMLVSFATSIVSHHFAVLLAIILGACACVVIVVERKWKDFAWFAGTIAGACLVVAGWAAGRLIIRDYLFETVSWINTPPSTVLRWIPELVVRGSGFNAVAFGAAATALLFLAFEYIAPRQEKRRISSLFTGAIAAESPLQPVVVFGSALALYFFIIVAVSTKWSFVVERYLICVVGAVCVILADLGTQVISRHKWAFIALVANAALFSGFRLINDTSLRNFVRWNGTADIIAEAVEDDPSAKIIIFLAVVNPPARAPGEEFGGLAAFSYVASKHKISNELIPLPADLTGFEGKSIIFWGEMVCHELRQTLPEAERFIEVAELPIPPQWRTRIKMETSYAGVVISFPNE